MSKMVKYMSKDYGIVEEVKIEGVKNVSSRIAAEYKYIIEKYGIPEKDWKLISQAIVKEKDWRSFDVLNIEFPDGHIKIIYFDRSLTHEKFL